MALGRELEGSIDDNRVGARFRRIEKTGSNPESGFIWFFICLITLAHVSMSWLTKIHSAIWPSLENETFYYILLDQSTC